MRVPVPRRRHHRLLASEALSVLYRFLPYTTADILQSLRRFGFVDMRVLPLTATEFPANLTRVGVIARKS
jgi:hypothetical protein